MVCPLQHLPIFLWHLWIIFPLIPAELVFGLLFKHCLASNSHLMTWTFTSQAVFSLGDHVLLAISSFSILAKQSIQAPSVTNRKAQVPPKLPSLPEVPPCRRSVARKGEECTPRHLTSCLDQPGCCYPKTAGNRGAKSVFSSAKHVKRAFSTSLDSLLWQLQSHQL